MDKTWLTANKYSGSGGGTIRLTAKANNTLYDRVTTVTGKTSKGKTATVICRQQMHINFAFRDTDGTISQDTPTCVGCGACISFQDNVNSECPNGVTVDMYADSEGVHIELDAANASKCVEGCGICLESGAGSVCPVGEEIIKIESSL